MASQAYFQGDWYNAIAQASAGESPATNPEKWVKIEIPYYFGRFVTEKANAYLLGADGQSDKRAQADAYADEILGEVLMRHCDNGEIGQTRVLTR